MDLFQLNQINPLVVVLALACLCVGGVVVLAALNVIGTILHLISSVFALFFHAISVDPSGGCGCLIILFLCAGVACGGIFVSSLISTCGTPDAVRFCTWIGR